MKEKKRIKTLIWNPRSEFSKTMFGAPEQLPAEWEASIPGQSLARLGLATWWLPTGPGEQGRELSLSQCWVPLFPKQRPLCSSSHACCCRGTLGARSGAERGGRSQKSSGQGSKPGTELVSGCKHLGHMEFIVTHALVLSQVAWGFLSISCSGILCLLCLPSVLPQTVSV